MEQISVGRNINRRRFSIVRYLVYSYGLFIFSGSQLIAGGIKDDAESLIKSYFGNEVSVDFKKVSVDPELQRTISKKVKQRFYRNEVYTWKIMKDDDIRGYAILDNVKGKSLPITFLVLFDPNGQVIHSAVIKYREPIGGEIGHPNWNRQFLGYTADSLFRVGQDIDGISGATISVNAMTRGIHKLSYLIQTIKNKL